MDSHQSYILLVMCSILETVIVICVILASLKMYYLPETRVIDAIRSCLDALRRKVMDRRWRMTALAGMVYDTKEGSMEEVGGGCAICLSEYADGERRATIATCNHRFHALCIETWIKEKYYTCPLCRHDLV